MKQSVYIFFLLFFLIISGIVKAQTGDSITQLGIIKDGDTIIHRNIEEIMIHPNRYYIFSQNMRRYNRFVNKVKKVYPYAKIAGEMLKEYEPIYVALDSDKERRKMMKSLERQLLDQYKDDLKRMTISEGQILLKLIDRETSRTSYTIIKEFRGGVSAFFWQGIAKIFGSNLKTEYDQDGEDRVIEEIITMIEAGYW